jgi:hypothetical protein
LVDTLNLTIEPNHRTTPRTLPAGRAGWSVILSSRGEYNRRGLRPGDTKTGAGRYARTMGLVLSIKILAMVSLAVCSLSVDAEALTTKQNICHGTNGFCYVNCDPGTVVVVGGWMNISQSVGISASYPASDRQWVCRPTARSISVIVYAICQ